jgi:serine/threonine protein kinase
MSARDKATGEEFAMKILDKRHILKEKKVKYVNIEKDVLHRLKHPFVVQLFSTFQDANSLCW